ncbi:MAG: TolC family protein [Saprospiraceae bacterium]|nr:TolC family protein [Saprospiraceae bacterium]
MKNIKLIFFLLAFLIVSQTYSQKIWSLRDCIDYALENNIQIKQQLLNVELNEANLLQNRANLLPNLNAGGTHVYNYGSTIDRFAGTFTTERIRSNNFYIQSQVTLFNGFQLLNAVKQNQFNLMSSKYNVDKVKDDMALAIATAYLQILYNIEMYDIAQGQLEITLQQVERTKKLVEAGTMAKGGLLTIEAQAASEELNVVNAKNQLDISYLTLIQLLDLNASESFEIEKPELSISSETPAILRPDQIFEFAVNNQPGIKSAEFQIKSSEKGLDIAKGSRSPSLSISGSYGTGYSGANQIGKDLVNSVVPIGYTSGFDTVYGLYSQYSSYETKSFSNQLDDNSNYSVGLYLNIPIFNGFATKTSVTRAKIGIQNSEYNLQLQKNQLLKTIQQAHADAAAALNSFTATQKSVSALAESFKYTEQKFNVGMVNSVEYNDAKNKLITAKSQLLQAKYEYIFRTKVLDFYMGKPLNLN